MVPALSVDSVRKRRDHLRGVLAPFCGIELCGDDLRAAAAALASDMKCQVDVLTETLRRTTTGMLTVEGAFNLAWRLAGNIDVLRSGEPLQTFQPPSAPMLAPAQFLSMRRHRTTKGKPLAVYKVRFLAGPACPLLTEKPWPVNFVPVLARELGFPPPWKPGAYHDPADLVRLRFQAEIMAEFCSNGHPGFYRAGCASADKAWNRQMFLARAHIKPPCPRNYEHPCHRCPIGYDQCRAGTHPVTYVFATCRLCQKEDAPHDPASDSGNCLTCDSKELMA